MRQPRSHFTDVMKNHRDPNIRLGPVTIVTLIYHSNVSSHQFTSQARSSLKYLTDSSIRQVMHYLILSFFSIPSVHIPKGLCIVTYNLAKGLFTPLYKYVNCRTPLLVGNSGISLCIVFPSLPVSYRYNILGVWWCCCCKNGMYK